MDKEKKTISVMERTILIFPHELSFSVLSASSALGLIKGS